MQMLMHVRFPIDPFNAAVRDGKCPSDRDLGIHGHDGVGGNDRLRVTQSTLATRASWQAEPHLEFTAHSSRALG